MRILITGSNGQLGKTFQELYSNLEEIEFVFTSKEDLDITDKKNVNNYFKENRFDYCINCAAYTNVEKAENQQEKAFLINVEGVKNLALTCRENQVILIHISTDYVFDGKKNQPYTESDVTKPLNVYGKSKLKGEEYIEGILEDYFIIRTSWLYSKFGNNFLKTIAAKIKNNENLNVVSSQKGVPTSSNDLAKFIYFLILNKTNTYGIYHFTALGETSWYGFAKQIASNFKWYDLNKIQPKDTYPTKAKRPNYSVLDTKKVQEIYSEIDSWALSVNDTIQSLSIE